MRLNWVRKSDPQSSPVFLLDADISHYYYPIATSLSGTVVAGHPRIGLVAFEPLRAPTTSIELHCSEVQLQKGRGGKQTFSFLYRDPALADHINQLLTAPRLSEQAATVLQQEAQKLRSRVSHSHSGCLTVLVGIIIALTWTSLATFL